MTTKESIIDYFMQFGAITDAVAMFQNGKPRCFGFVTFEDPEVAEQVLQEVHVLDGHTVDAKSAVPRPEEGGKGGVAFHDFGAPTLPAGAGMAPRMYDGGRAAPAPRPLAPRSKQGGTEKVFVGGLAPECSDEMFIEYFSQYGQLVDSVVMKDKLTGKPKGFGFVQYDNAESVEVVMQDYERHQLCGKWIEVKRAVPREQMGGAPPMPSMGKKGGGFAKGFGGGPGSFSGKGGFGGGYGGYGGGYGGAHFAPAPFAPQGKAYGKGKCGFAQPSRFVPY